MKCATTLVNWTMQMDVRQMKFVKILFVNKKKIAEQFQTYESLCALFPLRFNQCTAEYRKWSSECSWNSLMYKLPKDLIHRKAHWYAIVTTHSFSSFSSVSSRRRKLFAQNLETILSKRVREGDGLSLSLSSKCFARTSRRN